MRIREDPCLNEQIFLSGTVIVTFCHHKHVNSGRPAGVKRTALNTLSRNITESKSMKTIFAALASALLVSTAFAQTAAPATAEAHLKAPKSGVGLKAGVSNTSVSANNAVTDAPAVKPAAGAKTKTHAKVAQKKHAAEANVARAKTDAGNEANATQARADNTKAETTKTQ